MSNIIKNVQGVPNYSIDKFNEKQKSVCMLIPIINEGERILTELKRALNAEIDKKVDIILCDGGSTDGSMEHERLKNLGVNTLLTKLGEGKQGAQLRMGIHFAMQRGYSSIITIDGNNKDSIEHVPLFLEKLSQGYDLVQGSRFIKGGVAENTPLIRHIAVRFIHAPIISLTAHQWFTDTTNAYRAYSMKYLTHPQVKPLRDCFMTYELLAYLSTRATQLKLKATEVPVARIYPKNEPTPTKIKGIQGNTNLFKILIANFFGKYNP